MLLKIPCSGGCGVTLSVEPNEAVTACPNCKRRDVDDYVSRRLAEIANRQEKEPKQTKGWQRAKVGRSKHQT